MAKLPFGRIEGDWSDRPVFVIGGGPSLNGFDFSVLDGITVGANKTAFAADCDVITSLDRHFIHRCHDDIVAFVEKGREAYFALSPSVEHLEVIPGAVYVQRGRNNELSSEPNQLNGVHSGYCALNLAFVMGAREIHLLGMDMQYSNDRTGQSHFHGGYDWQPSHAPRFYDKWSRNFESAAVQLEAAGVEVTNWIGTPVSKIQEFKTRPLTELADPLRASSMPVEELPHRVGAGTS